MTWLWSWQVYLKSWGARWNWLSISPRHRRRIKLQIDRGLHGFTTSCHTETIEHEDRYDHWDGIMRTRIELGDYKWVCAIIGDHTDVGLMWNGDNVWRSLSQAYWLMRGRLGINWNGCNEFAVPIWVADLNLTLLIGDHSTKIGFCYQYW